MLPQSAFQVGDVMEVLHQPGRTGTVLLVDVYERRYLLDPHPGAWAPYHYMLVPGPAGQRLVAACWVDEHLLRKPRE